MPSLDPATEEAIDWMVRLDAGRAGADVQQRFAQWHASDVRHAQAWNALQQRLGQPLDAVRALDSRLPGQARQAREVLLRPTRRTLLRALALAAPVGAGLLLADRVQPLGALIADFSTGTGERRSFSLADGSELTLNARTRVDASFVAGAPQLRLREGDIVLQVADHAAHPVSVLSGESVTRVLGARVMVRKEPQATRVTALAHRVEVLAAQGQSEVLRAQQGVRISATGIQRLADNQVDSADWLQGLLVVNRRPLSYVLGELQRYRRDLLRVSDAAADILVQGVFPLGDVDRALLVLSETLPITVSRYGPWLTRIDARAK